MIASSSTWFVVSAISINDHGSGRKKGFQIFIGSSGIFPAIFPSVAGIQDAGVRPVPAKKEAVIPDPEMISGSPNEREERCTTGIGQGEPVAGDGESRGLFHPGEEGILLQHDALPVAVHFR